jgi:hypothetical protein
MKLPRAIAFAMLLAVGIAGLALPSSAQLVAPCTGTAPGVEGTICTFCDLLATGQNVLNFAIFDIAAVLLGIGVVYGGILLMVSGGNEELRRRGLDALRRAVYGFVIVFCAWVIVNTIINAFAEPSAFPWWPWNEVRCP